MPEIEVVQDYKKQAPKEFWRSFPKFKPEDFVSGPINVDRLEKMIKVVGVDGISNRKKTQKFA